MIQVMSPRIESRSHMAVGINLHRVMLVRFIQLLGLAPLILLPSPPTQAFQYIDP
jgi:hypothetical protein